MKNPKAETTETTAAKSADVKHYYGFPTPEQIAHIAATLAKGSGENPASLARAALNLWNAAEDLHICEIRDYRIPDYGPPLQSTKLADFLRKVLPGTRLENREQAWKHYNLNLAGIDPQKATADQEKEARLKWEPPQNFLDFIDFKNRFLNWWQKYHATEVSKARSRPGKVKKKKKRKARPQRKQLKEIVSNLIDAS